MWIHGYTHTNEKYNTYAFYNINYVNVMKTENYILWDGDVPPFSNPRDIHTCRARAPFNILKSNIKSILWFIVGHTSGFVVIMIIIFSIFLTV